MKKDVVNAGSMANRHGGPGQIRIAAVPTWIDAFDETLDSAGTIGTGSDRMRCTMERPIGGAPFPAKRANAQCYFKTFAALGLRVSRTPKQTKWRVAVSLFLIFVGVTGTSADKAYAASALPRKIDRPLIFVPGILGSRLCDSKGRVVWGNFDSLINLQRLELKADGSEESMRPCGIVKQIQILGPLFSLKQYSLLVSSLKNMGYVENKNLFVFAYDWRKSNWENEKLLERFVSEKFGQTDKFDLLVHSMGGIITKIYLATETNRSRVNKVVYMGTPFLGSAATFATLSKGWGAIENLMTGGKEAIHRIVLSFPGFVELLPRYKCCYVRTQSDTQDWLDIFDVGVWERLGWLPRGQVSQSWRDKFREALGKAKALSSALSPSSPPTGVKEVLIAGDAHSTPLKLGMKWDNTNIRGWIFGEDLGDGTVPVWSAANNQSFNDLAGTLESFSQHATIFNDRSVVAQIEREFLNIEPGDGTEPIGKKGKPSVQVEIDGRPVFVDVILMQLTPDAPTQFVDSRIHGDFVVVVDSQGNNSLPSGALHPIGTLLFSGKKANFDFQEISTSSELQNNRHHFSFDVNGSAHRGFAEIKAALGDKAITSSFVSFLERPVRQ